MKATQMTRAQLREAIAEKQGWILSPQGAIEGVSIPKWHNQKQNVWVSSLPDYLGDMNAAMPLLRELPGSSLEITQEATYVLWVGDDGSLTESAAPPLCEAEAIACAWWQYTTGEVVELVNE